MRKVKEKKERVGRKNNHLLNRRDAKKGQAIFP